jgi:hypothetical protein
MGGGRVWTPDDADRDDDGSDEGLERVEERRPRTARASCGVPKKTQARPDAYFNISSTLSAASRCSVPRTWL